MLSIKYIGWIPSVKSKWDKYQYSWV